MLTTLVGADALNARATEARVRRWWNRDHRPEWSSGRSSAFDRFLIGFAIAGLGEPIVDACYADALVELFDDYPKTKKLGGHFAVGKSTDESGSVEGPGTRSDRSALRSRPGER
jgi:hypothetical protein